MPYIVLDKKGIKIYFFSDFDTENANAKNNNNKKKKRFWLAFKAPNRDISKTFYARACAE